MSTISHHNPISQLLVLGLVSFLCFGCQSFTPKTSGELTLKNHDFIGLWDTYNECLTGFNQDAIKRDLEILRSAPKPISLDDSPIPVPKFLKNLSSDRNSRLAVDPRAMTASCSIHLAKIAEQSADWDTALETWQSIVDQYPETQYAFYVSEASKAIEEFSAIKPVSFKTRNWLER